MPWFQFQCFKFHCFSSKFGNGLIKSAVSQSSKWYLNLLSSKNIPTGFGFYDKLSKLRTKVKRQQLIPLLCFSAGKRLICTRALTRNLKLHKSTASYELLLFIQIGCQNSNLHLHHTCRYLWKSNWVLTKIPKNYRIRQA